MHHVPQLYNPLKVILKDKAFLNKILIVPTKLFKRVYFKTEVVSFHHDFNFNHIILNLYYLDTVLASILIELMSCSLRINFNINEKNNFKLDK